MQKLCEAVRCSIDGNRPDVLDWFERIPVEERFGFAGFEALAELKGYKLLGRAAYLSVWLLGKTTVVVFDECMNTARGMSLSQWETWLDEYPFWIPEVVFPEIPNKKYRLHQTYAVINIVYYWAMHQLYGCNLPDEIIGDVDVEYQ